jgi:hypothetical protein
MQKSIRYPAWNGTTKLSENKGGIGDLKAEGPETKDEGPDQRLKTRY